MDVPLVQVEKASKKFCRRLRRSLWYGVRDLGSELIGRNHVGKDLRKDEFWAVRDVSFELRRGETLGLIGPNGAGKTTLLRMLNGLLKIDSGKIQVHGRMQALIALGAGFNPILSGRENIYVNAAILGIPRKQVDKNFDTIVEFSGIGDFIDTPVQNYSSGMFVRLGFSVAAHMNPDILLVDEVLAVGDHGFQSKCLNKIGELRKKGTGIILVSHNMHTILTYSSKIALLNKGHCTLFANVNEGANRYNALFYKDEKTEIQKICSGNEYVKFRDIAMSTKKLVPGSPFIASLPYESSVDYDDVEIDIAIYSSKENFLHFQATNKAYSKGVDIKEGNHTLQIVINDIRINNASALITITIWTRNRIEQLFWWRIPVVFEGKEHSTGNNFLNVDFHTINQVDENKMSQ